MRKVNVADMKLPVLAVGCMGLDKAGEDGTRALVSAAMDEGLNFFDHADIYGDGACESLFGDAMRALGIPRGAYVLQSKCGIIRGKRYDFSTEHIVAAAFDKLEGEGKVLRFGVSNMHPYQIELLQSGLRQKLCVDQLQFSPAHAGMVACGMEVNMNTPGAAARDGYALDYCRLHGIAVQAWSPLRYGLLEGIYLDDPKFASLNAALADVAAKYGVTKAAVAAAWILRHPAVAQVVTGTSNAKRLLEMAEGARVELSRAEWYEIYLSAGNMLP